MFRAFRACQQALAPDGRLVIVFAHKQPDAWETLASALIRAGFVVDASWPIQTEMGNRTRAQSSAALSSSVWLVCRKRPARALGGWDHQVLAEMRANIRARLREYWDAGIRGPDFVWAATGPALEAYSKHPVVKKANEPGKIMSVSEFLRAVRRIVVDFVVGQVLSQDGEASASLDPVTSYYLLHRHDFGLEPAPVGPCILYALSCGVSDQDLVDRYNLLVRAGGSTAEDADDEDDSLDDAETDDAEAAEVDESADGGRGGSKVRLKPWSQRASKGLGLDAPGRPAPLIDQVHRLMQLWKEGDVAEVDGYADDRALRENPILPKLIQALIELAAAGSEERSTLESISNHLAATGATKYIAVTLDTDPPVEDRRDRMERMWHS